MFSGVVRDAVGFKKRFDRAIRSAHPVDKVDFFDGMRGSDCSIEKVGIGQALFRLRKNARFSLGSKMAIRLRKNWRKRARARFGHALACHHDAKPDSSLDLRRPCSSTKLVTFHTSSQRNMDGVFVPGV